MQRPMCLVDGKLFRCGEYELIDSFLNALCEATIDVVVDLGDLVGWVHDDGGRLAVG